MQLKGMLASCKKLKRAEIILYNEARFLSDGRTAMCIERIAPDWGLNDILTAMDLPENTRDDILTVNHTVSENVNPDELVQLTRLRYSLNVNGDALQPFLFPDGRVVFVDLELTRVFRDEKGKEYFCDPTGLPIIYITSEIGLIGTVLPSRVNLESMRIFLSELSKGVYAAAEAGFLDTGGQMEIGD